MRIVQRSLVTSRIWTKFPRSALPERFGTVLADARIAAGLTQSALAAACGTTRETIYRIERHRSGKKPRYPSSRVVFAIATALGIDPGTIIEGWPEAAEAELPGYSARIRHRRRRLRLTLAAVAKATGVTAATLSRFECETALPRKLLELTRDEIGNVVVRIVSDELAVILGFSDAAALDDYCNAPDLDDAGMAAVVGAEPVRRTVIVSH